jgi:hypothetical protein
MVARLAVEGCDIEAAQSLETFRALTADRSDCDFQQLGDLALAQPFIEPKDQDGPLSRWHSLESRPE